MVELNRLGTMHLDADETSRLVDEMHPLAKTVLEIYLKAFGDRNTIRNNNHNELSVPESNCGLATPEFRRGGCEGTYQTGQFVEARSPRRESRVDRAPS